MLSLHILQNFLGMLKLRETLYGYRSCCSFLEKVAMLESSIKFLSIFSHNSFVPDSRKTYKMNADLKRKILMSENIRQRIWNFSGLHLLSCRNGSWSERYKFTCSFTYRSVLQLQVHSLRKSSCHWVNNISSNRTALSTYFLIA